MTHETDQNLIITLLPEELHILRLRASGLLLTSLIDNDRLEVEVCVTTYSTRGKPTTYGASVRLKSRVAPIRVYPFPSVFTSSTLTTEEYNNHFPLLLGGFVDFLSSFGIPYQKESVQ